MDGKDKVGLTIGFAIFIGLGLLAVVKPDFTEGYEAAGQRAFFKQLLADYWGPKLGFAMMALGALALVGLHQKQ